MATDHLNVPISVSSKYYETTYTILAYIDQVVMKGEERRRSAMCEWMRCDNRVKAKTEPDVTV